MYKKFLNTNYVYWIIFNRKYVTQGSFHDSLTSNGVSLPHLKMGTIKFYFIYSNELIRYLRQSEMNSELKFSRYLTKATAGNLIEL